MLWRGKTLTQLDFVTGPRNGKVIFSVYRWVTSLDCSLKESLRITFFSSVQNILYHFDVLFIFVRFPGITISRKGQLEHCSPLITIYIALSSNTTNMDCFSKINLKPFAIARGGPWAPAITSGIMQSTVIRHVIRIELGRCCDLIIKNSCRRWHTDCFASSLNNENKPYNNLLI